MKKRKRWSGWRRRRSVLIEEGEGEEEQLQEVREREERAERGGRG